MTPRSIAPGPFDDLLGPTPDDEPESIDDMLGGPTPVPQMGEVPAPDSRKERAQTGSVVPVSALVPDGADLASFVQARFDAFQTAPLSDLEVVIDSGLRSFVEVGLALASIRERRLYRDTHATFDDYCKDRWGFTGRRARQLIASASVVEDLGPDSPVPANERQARELAKVPADQRCDVWGDAQATAAAEDRPPTAADVREAVHERTAPTAPQGSSNPAPVSSPSSSPAGPQTAAELPSASEPASSPGPSSPSSEPAADTPNPAALVDRIAGHVRPLTNIDVKRITREATTPFARRRVISLATALEDWTSAVRAALAVDASPEDDENESAA